MRTIPEVCKTDIEVTEGIVSISQYRGYTTHQIFVPVEMLKTLQDTITNVICDAIAPPAEAAE